MPLRNEVALATGACAAKRFLEAGAAVVAFDINDERTHQMAERLNRQGRALVIHRDVALEAGVEIAVAWTDRELGALDVLVNNAGITPPGPAADLNAAEWDHQLAFNLKGVFLFRKHAIRHLLYAGHAERCRGSRAVCGLRRTPRSFRRVVL